MEDRMIIDSINNLYRYSGLGIAADKITEFVQYAKKVKLCQGRYDILGDDLFALVQRYNTKDEAECLPESHKQYIDLQYIVEGREELLWDFSDKLKIVDNRTSKEDIIFYEKTSGKARVILEGDMFAMLFPYDAHIPCLHCGEPSKVYKIVFKIRNC
jgi:biofilm protein TabA